MTWFEKLTGVSSESPEQVKAQLEVNKNILTSRVNGKKFNCGELETPCLGELRTQVHDLVPATGKISLREVVGDVQALHLDDSNAGATFQVASQFNLLEMVSPENTPEMGVGIYEFDRTQGPACAIACGAGTIYRNYFAEVNEQIGQTATNQIDCLSDIGAELGNTDNRLWEMKNGYALATRNGLMEISERLRSSSSDSIDDLMQLLRIGVHSDTQVTIGDCQHTVMQAYCSALPVAYSSIISGLWEGFARMVLDASYEATICAAILNVLKTNNNRVFLTLLGGGAFGNNENWIISSIERALGLYKNYDLDVMIVSYGSSKESVRELIKRFN